MQLSGRVSVLIAGFAIAASLHAPGALAQPAPPPTPDPTPAAPTRPAPSVIDALTRTQPDDANKSSHEKRLAAAAACNAHEPTCDWIMTFSSLEKLSIRRSLAKLALDVEPSPWGKVVGTIRIVNEDVFAEDNWLTFFNIFHVTSRESTVRGELTISEGQVWDDKLIEESSRRLKDPLFTSVVALLPLKSAEENKVDLLVVTRDIWSLRLNTQYAIQQGALTGLSMSLSENNFLGRRKTVAIGLLVDQGSITMGPLYIDKNFLGEHLDFRFRIDRIFTRQSLDVVDYDPATMMFSRQPSDDPPGLQDEHTFRTEGSQATVALTKTLWSLASKWGGGGSFTYRNAINRTYLGTGLRAVDNPDTPARDFLPREYRMRSWNVRGSITRQWGDAYKQQVEAGYSVSSQTPSLLPSFTSDPVMQAFFRDEVFPRTEVISSPTLEYSIFRASYRTIRNVDTFDLAEDVRLGPNLTVGLQQSLGVFGSTYYFTRPSLVLGWTFPWTRDGFLRLSTGGQGRFQDGEWIDNTATAQVRAATPTFRMVRLIAQAHFETRWNDTQNAFYSLGSDAGLRAYDIGQFIGNRRVVGQIEARTTPIPWWVLRLGAVAFYEVGGVAVSFNEMTLHHDVGVGFRMLIPQTARDLFRFDFSIPLDGENRCVLPGGYKSPGNICFVAGFDSYF